MNRRTDKEMKRLSRIRKKTADFPVQYCGEYGSGRCKCRDRVSDAIESHRIDPLRPDYVTAEEIPIQTVRDVKNVMEEIDSLSQYFSFCKPYRAPEHTKNIVREFLDSAQMSIIKRS